MIPSKNSFLAFCSSEEYSIIQQTIIISSVLKLSLINLPFVNVYLIRLQKKSADPKDRQNIFLCFLMIESHYFFISQSLICQCSKSQYLIIKKMNNPVFEQYQAYKRLYNSNLWQRFALKKDLQRTSLFSNQYSTLRSQCVKGSINQKLNQRAGERVSNTQIFPYRCIGKLCFAAMNFHIQKYTDHYGTAFLIAFAVILTAAHNLFDKRTFSYSQNIQFVPSCRNRGITIISYEIAKGYISLNRQEDDYAIAFLQSDIGSELGYFGIAANNFTQNMMLEIAGYPGDQEGLLWRQQRANETRLDRGILSYRLTTISGNSGSPVFFRKGSSCYAMCVHTQGSNQLEIQNAPEIRNSGIYINEEIFRSINQLIKQSIQKYIHLKNQLIIVNYQQVVFINWVN